MLITSPNNHRLKAARKLNQRRHREANDSLLIEGVRLIADALQSKMQPKSVFYAPALVADNHRACELLHRLQAMDVELLACTPEAFGTLSDTVSPQGIAAITPFPHLPLPAHPTLTLVLDGVRDPGNAGAILRSAEAAGVELVILAPGSVDPFNEKAMRAGMGVHFRLPLRTCEQWGEVQRLFSAEQRLYVAEATGQVAYDEVDWSLPAVLIVGNEATGPSPEAQSLAQAIAIPMHGCVESLNAAVAGSIILFEAARQRRHFAK